MPMRLVPKSRSIFTAKLPFLYETETILRSCVRYSSTDSNSESRPGPRIRRGSAKGRRLSNHEPFKDKPEAGARALARMLEKRSATKQESELARKAGNDKPDTGEELDEPPNIFAQILRDTKKASRTTLPRTRERSVTMTQAEQEIFERLQTLSGKKQASLTEEDAPVDELDNPDIGEETLETLFDRLSAKLSKEKLDEKNEEFRSEQSLKGLWNKITAANNRRTEQLRSDLLEDVAWPQPENIEPAQYRLAAPNLSDSAIAKLEDSRIKQVNGLRNHFTKLQTDKDLWKILDGYVFRIMRDLNVNLEQQQNLRRKPPIKQGTSKLGDGAVYQVEKLSQVNSDSNKELMQQVTNTYGPAVLYATRLFRKGFPRSPYVSLILPMIKQLGPISYVLAASTSFYNELLYIRWEHYRDINGCANIYEEMITQNVLADRRTALIFQVAKDARDHALRLSKRSSSRSVPVEKHDPIELDSSVRSPPDLDWNEKGTKNIPFGTPVKSLEEGWWRLQGTEAAWLRWNTARNRLITMTRLELQRKKDEQALANQHSESMLNPPEDEDNSQGARVTRFASDKDENPEPEIEILSPGHMTAQKEDNAWNRT